MPETTTATTTVLQALLDRLERAAAYNPNTQVAPAAVLWTDEKREWEPLLPRLRSELPHLLTLGDYDPAQRVGPAIWLKTMIARALPEAKWPEDAVPVVYLPGISRQRIRAVESTPRTLQPLAELQYRGVLWSQYNGRDWTLLAFLTSEEGGLGLDVARDAATQEAMARALLELADIPVPGLSGKRLEAEDFDALLNPDPVRVVLQWLNDPEGMRERWPGGKWSSFCTICDRFGFDPVRDGALSAAEKLGLRRGSWAEVWQRFVEAPRRYPNIPGRLRQARPVSTGDLFSTEETWPQDNEALEDELRRALSALDGVMPAQAAQKVLALEQAHGRRRQWVWAELGQARLAGALHDLAELARATVRQFKNQYAVPTYVVEFLLGRYCASVDEEEIQEGLAIVQRQLANRTARAGQEELFKSRAREKGSIKIIDLIRARLDARTDSYIAELPSLQLRDVRIDAEVVQTHERMLTGGFYAEIQLGYDPIVAQEKSGRPFSVDTLREIQLSTHGVTDTLIEARKQFTAEEWIHFLLRSIGFEPDALSERARDVILLRMVPFVERNYNMVELGPRGTGKSHLFQQVSPYAHLVSGGKTTVARMFVNMASGQRGLVCQYDVVCFDEVSGVSFDQKDGVNIMKGYMESGEFSRGKESIRADGGIVMVGNFDVDIEHQQRIGHLFGPLPSEMRDDTAFMDRIHAYLPGWDIPKLNTSYFTDHFGLVSDFLSECWTHLRGYNRSAEMLGRVFLGGALSGRDTTAVQKTVSGLLKLIHPDPEEPVPDERLEWAVKLALEVRRRVKEQQKRIGSAEFRNTQFSFRLGEDGVEQFVVTPELQSENQIGSDPLPPGQVWTISPGSMDEHPGLCRIEVTTGPGSSVRILNRPSPPPFTESVRYAEQNLYAQAMSLVGDRAPRSHEFSVQLRTFDTARSGSGTGLAVLLALSSALLQQSIRGGLIVAGAINLGGSIDPLYNAVNIAELAVEKGATILLMPVSSRRQLFDLSDDMATRISIQFYTDARDALLKGLVE